MYDILTWSGVPAELMPAPAAAERGRGNPCLPGDGEIEGDVSARDDRGHGQGEGGFVELPASEGAESHGEGARRAAQDAWGKKPITRVMVTDI